MKSMWRIFCFQTKKTLSSLLFWIGIIILSVITIHEFYPYLTAYPAETEQQIEQGRKDGRYYDYQIPLKGEELYTYVLTYLENTMIHDLKLSSDDVSKYMKEIRSKHMSYSEIEGYLSESAGAKIQITRTLESITGRPANITEYNQHVKKKLLQVPFSEYFARKYGDLFTLYVLFAALVTLPFLFENDMKDNVYELLHSKTIPSWKYVLGKVFGADFAFIIGIAIITAIVEVLLYLHCLKSNLPFNFINIWTYFIWWTVPSLIFSTFFLVAISILFRTGIAAIPVYFAYLFISSYPTYNSVGRVILSVKPWSLLIRISNNTETFFGDLTETFIQNVLVNRICIFSATVFCALLAISFYSKRGIKKPKGIIRFISRRN